MYAVGPLLPLLEASQNCPTRRFIIHPGIRLPSDACYSTLTGGDICATLEYKLKMVDLTLRCRVVNDLSFLTTQVDSVVYVKPADRCLPQSLISRVKIKSQAPRCTLREKLHVAEI